MIIQANFIAASAYKHQRLRCYKELQYLNFFDIVSKTPQKGNLSCFIKIWIMLINIKVKM